MDLFKLGELVIIAGFCIGIYRIANGRLKVKVDRETCHAHVDGLKAMIGNVKEDITEVKQDVKEILRLSGKRHTG